MYYNNPCFEVIQNRYENILSRKLEVFFEKNYFIHFDK